jgi:tRNA (guanine-N7-)-methyltransferase
MRNIILPIRLPWPANWADIYGRSAPLIIEIGFGNGDFLIDLGQKRPDHNILGLEISLPSLGKAERKIERLGLDNVWPMQGRAETTLWTLCAENSVSEIFINFPDPWPKPDHNRRRLVNVDFLHLVATRMPPGGKISIATDDASYAAWIKEALTQSPYFDSRFPSPYLTEDNERMRTKYEQKALDIGRTCHYFKWVRNSETAENIFPIPVEYPMPHAIIITPLSLDQISQQFAPQVWSQGETNVRANEVFRSQYHESLLVDVYLSEAALDQRLMVMITKRKEGDYLVHLHEVGFPRPTTGVHFAVYRLAQWLAGLDSNGRIESYKLTPGVVDD